MHALSIYHHFRQALRDGLVAVHPVSTTQQIADIWTKPLPQDLFVKFRKMLMKWWGLVHALLFLSFLHLFIFIFSYSQFSTKPWKEGVWGFIPILKRTLSNSHLIVISQTCTIKFSFDSPLQSLHTLFRFHTLLRTNWPKCFRSSLVKLTGNQATAHVSLGHMTLTDFLLTLLTSNQSRAWLIDTSNFNT